MNAHTSYPLDDDDVRVRRATITDVSEIARLLTQLGYPTTADDVLTRWQEWGDEGNSALVVESEAGALLGVCTLHFTRVLHRPKPVGRITAMVVDETARGRGIGRSLVQAAEQELTRLGCGMLEVTSNVRRVEAHAFYESLGFEKTSVRLFKSLEDDGMVVG
jgi:GNAT superfamily N-acetyltransferase